MIDLHSHVLAGVDDGPLELAGSLRLARAAVAAGTRVMAATPHIGTHFRVVPGELSGLVARLRDELAIKNVPLELVVGGELAPSHVVDATDADLRAIALHGGSCLLLECPFTPSHGLVRAAADHLQRKGYRVLLAHPERAPEFLQNPGSLDGMIAAGHFVQVTAGSLRGDFGRTVRRFSLALLDAGMVHVVASDAHDDRWRPPAVLPIVRQIAQRRKLPSATVQFLCVDVPLALLKDEAIPPNPVDERRGRRFVRPRRRRRSPT